MMKKITSIVLLFVLLTGAYALDKKSETLSQHALKRLSTWESLLTRLSQEKEYELFLYWWSLNQ